MAGFTRSEVTPLGYTATQTVWMAVSSATKAATAAADTDRLTYAKQGDIFLVSATDGVQALLLQSTGALADANA